MQDGISFRNQVVGLVGLPGTGTASLIECLAHQAGYTAFQARSALAHRDASRWAQPFGLQVGDSSSGYTRLHLIAAPASAEYRGQLESTLDAVDSVVLALHVGGDPIDEFADRIRERVSAHSLPLTIVLIRERGSTGTFPAAIQGIRSRWGNRCVPIELEVADPVRIVDVLAGPVPADLEQRSGPLLGEIEEDAAAESDVLLEKYVAGTPLDASERIAGLRHGILERHYIPIFELDLESGAGAAALLQEMVRLLPLPHERWFPEGPSRSLCGRADGPLIVRVWRTTADRYAGNASFLRILSGTLTLQSVIWNQTRRQPVRIGPLSRHEPIQREAISCAGPGDLVVAHKLEHVMTGDLLVLQSGADLSIPDVALDPPVYTQTLSIEQTSEHTRVLEALQAILKEDPSLVFSQDPETHEIQLAGYGDQHLGWALQTLRDRSGASVELHAPSVPYRETVRKVAETRYRHRKQSGGHGQYAEVFLRVEPMGYGEDDWFVDELTGPSVPRAFVPAIRKGIEESMQRGPLAGCPVVKTRVVLTGGSSHEVDSSDLAFRIAAGHAFTDALLRAAPELLEPVVELSVQAPDPFTGALTRDIGQRRGRVTSLETGQGRVQILAEVPQSEAIGYAIELKRLTHGTGCFRSVFMRYDPVPASLAGPVLAELKRKKAG